MDATKLKSALSLTAAVKLMAFYLETDPDVFMGYVQEDKLKGYPDVVAGSVWTAEGRLLYAIVKTIQAKNIIEIGTWAGASTAHLCAAAMQTGGTVFSVDTWEREAELVPEEYRSCLKLERSMGHEYVAHYHNSVDLIFEDADHNYKTSYMIAKEGKKALRPGGYYITHDTFAEVEGMGDAIRKALFDNGMNGLDILVRPSNCGLSIWRKPNA